MIKGGFQGLDISGVDLTEQSPSLPGAYAACAAADGKPIRVLTADGAVQCSVKKVSTNYMLAGVTGDGKILSIAVGATDGIEVIETVIPEVEIRYFLNILQNDINIATATSADPYLTEHDGIVVLRNTSADTDNSTVVVYAEKEPSSKLVSGLLGGVVANERKACFVRKGTYLYVSGANPVTTVKFVEYLPDES